MKKLDFSTFIQILVLLVTAYIAFQNLLPKERVDLIGIILFWTFVALTILYSIILTFDVKFIQKLKKVDRLEDDFNKLKEFLDYKKVTEDLNIRLKIIEDRMNRKGILSPQAVILIIIIILVIIYVLRSQG